MTFPIDLPKDEWPIRRQQNETPPEKFTRTQSMLWCDAVLDFKKHTRAKFAKVGFYLYMVLLLEKKQELLIERTFSVVFYCFILSRLC